MLYLKRFVKAAFITGALTVSLSSCGAAEGALRETETETQTNYQYSSVEEPASNVVMTVSAGGYVPTETNTETAEPETEENSESAVYEAGRTTGTSISRRAPEGYNLPAKKQLEFETVFQRPELPTGCEVTALAQTLNYFDFDIDKVELCEKFLELDFDAFYSMDNAYVGDPYSEYGYGCNAPVITNTADDYFGYLGSDWRAHNMTGSDFDDLLYQIAEGRPVIIWVTLDLMDTNEPIFQYTSKSGDDMYFTNLQHCVTIYGYDKEEKIIYTADPLKGNVQYGMEQFRKIYEAMGKQAVVLWGNQDTKGKDLSTDEEKEAYLERIENARVAKKSHYLSLASGNGDETEPETEEITEAPTEPPTAPPTTVPETTTVTIVTTVKTTAETTENTAPETTAASTSGTTAKTTSKTTAKTTASTSTNTTADTTAVTTTGIRLFGIRIS